MTLRRLGLCVALALAVSACNKTGSKAVAVGPGAANTARPQLRHKGAAHSAAIDRVSLSLDGSTVLTRDTTGGIRLWPGLDGSKEPIPVPARGVEHFTVAPRPGGAGWTVATVEASGQAVFQTVKQTGEHKQLVALPPFEPVIEAHVLPGGDKIITLHRDHSIRMLTSSGKEIGRFVRRKFSPTQLRVSADGRHLVAIEVKGRQGNAFEGLAYPIDQTGNPAKLFVGREPEPFRTPFAPTPNNAAVSPDGRLFVVFSPDRQGQKLRAVIYDLTRPGARRSLPTEVPASTQPTVGFIGREQILVSGAGGSGNAWQIDLHTGRTVPRTGPPREAQGVITSGRVQIGGYGTWLFVQDVARSSQKFLGYQSFRPSSVAFSPSGASLAWGYDRAEIYVEPFIGPDRAPARLESDVPSQMRDLFFVDEQRVLGVDTANQIMLVDWSRGEVVAESSVQWSLSVVAYEPDTGLLLLDGGHQGKRIVEVDPKQGFTGQYVLPDQSRSAGLFSKKAGSKAVLWTADLGDNKLRSYGLAELRRGVTPDEVAAKGELLGPGRLVGIDRQGHRYTASSDRITVARGVQSKTIELRSEKILPSWDGAMMLAMVRDDAGGFRAVAYDTESMQEVWTHQLPVFVSAAAWTRDGRFVALASESGGIVLDAKTGETLGFRCGLSFEAKGAPPRDAFGSSRARSVCDP